MAHRVAPFEGSRIRYNNMSPDVVMVHCMVTIYNSGLTVYWDWGDVVSLQHASFLQDTIKD